MFFTFVLGFHKRLLIAFELLFIGFFNCHLSYKDLDKPHAFKDTLTLDGHGLRLKICYDSSYWDLF